MIRRLARLTPRRLRPLARFAYRMAGQLTPPIVANAARRIDLELAQRPTRSEAVVLARNARFKNMYAGRRCFVIGNGPSLNKQDLSPLANEITIVMNQFNRHPIIEEWKPTMFCMAEPADNWDWRRLPSFLEKLDAQAYFYSIEYKELFDRHRWVDPGRVYYFRSSPISLEEWPRRKQVIDLAGTIPGSFTTAHLGLMLALYLGCSPIYLLGLDHDGLSRPSSMRWYHFYEDAQDALEDSKYVYRSRMELWLGIWRRYEALKDVADRRGVEIYNATAGGFLDVYPRLELGSLFPRSRM